MTINNEHTVYNKQFVYKVKLLEHQLDDVMEILDIDILKKKCLEVENDNQNNPSELNEARLGIIYHEVTLNLSFFSKSEYKGYAKKSFDVLNTLFESKDTTPELLPFVSAYRASALSLVAAETKKLSLISTSFGMFEEAVDKYAAISFIPEFMRGSVAENLPWIFFTKRKLAKKDFQSIIEKYEKDNRFANPKIMSFTYWAWAKQHQSKKDRGQALKYLDIAIALDPNYIGGRDRSEKLKAKMLM